jgi:DNA polymerase III subunit epsilon
VHGIDWGMVKDSPTFKEAWPHLSKILEGAEFMAAHNASFDSRVLAACCAAAGLPAPKLPFVCTVKLARETWDIRPTKLDNVCRHLGLTLNHHEALSDAEACANIVLLSHQRRLNGQEERAVDHRQQGEGDPQEGGLQHGGRRAGRSQRRGLLVLGAGSQAR